MVGTPLTTQKMADENDDEIVFSLAESALCSLPGTIPEGVEAGSLLEPISLRPKSDEIPPSDATKMPTMADLAVVNITNTTNSTSVLGGPTQDTNKETDEVSLGSKAKKKRKTLPTSVGTTPSPKAKNLAHLRPNEDGFEQGYDSDGHMGPFNYCLEIEGEQDYDEDEAPTGGPGPSRSEIDPSVNPFEKSETRDSEPLELFISISKEQMDKLKNKQLQEELRKRGCKVTGNKATLRGRLEKALTDRIPIGGKAATVVAVTTPLGPFVEQISGLAEGAYWRPLKPNQAPVEEPENSAFLKPRAPTIREEDAEFVPVKHDYSETFVRERFGATFEEDLCFSNGRQKYNTDGSAKKQDVTRERGRVNPDFIARNGLTISSHPADFVAAFLPLNRNKYSNRHQQQPSFVLFTKWTNMKAMLAGAGSGGVLYPTWQPFAVEEIRSHLGLYILNGLSPSPRVEYKFRPQSVDEVHGNDFVSRSFGARAELRHRQFKAFFAVQNPAIETPCRKRYPNWKIRPLLLWMNLIFPLAWLLGKKFSVDEQTIGFQGNHKDKKRITYKAEGDGFQADALCEDGFTFQFYYRNEPAPVKYLRQNLSPLHARVMALFDTVKDKYHWCGMDNLYNSASFCRAAYCHENKIAVHGVTRKGM